MGHYSSKCLEKKNVKEKTERNMAVTAAVENYAAKFEQEFSLVSIDSSVGSSVFENVWVVDSGATRHMSGVWCPPNAHCQQKSFGLLFPKWERWGLGGKQRARCCHLVPAPPFRVTPNEAKGGSP